MPDRIDASRGAPAVDLDAFDRIVVEHHASVRRLALRLLGWRDGADDVAQDVFLSAWGARAGFRAQASVELWLKRIAVNKCRSRLRRERVRLRWFGWLRATNLAESSAPIDDPLVDQERAERVRRAIESLAPRYGEVAVLHYLEQMSIDEIAQLTGARRNTVEVRLHRARRQLEVLLADLID